MTADVYKKEKIKVEAGGKKKPQQLYINFKCEFPHRLQINPVYSFK